MSLKEAQNPQAPLARLKELLDECDQPRQQFAAEVRAIGEMDNNAGPRLRAAKDRLDTAIANDQNRELLDAIAENPNLDREQWVRALEITPRAALRNSLLPLLLVERNPIIVADHELAALGSLAAFAISTPATSSAREALVDIICAGLPTEPETFGACFGEMSYTNLPEIAANRYCWDGAERWCMRSVAINDAGHAVIDALQGSDHPQARSAIQKCNDLGACLWSHSGHWKTYMSAIPFAPAGHFEFTYSLHTVVRDEYLHAEQKVIGWTKSSETVWSSRPGFMRGRTLAPGEDPPKEIAQVWSQWESSDYDNSGESNDLGYLSSSEPGDYKILQISEGLGACDGCAELTGCSLERQFSRAEIKRLSKLFGANSDAVKLAKNPKQSICPDCEAGRMALFATGTCEDCGYERESEDE